MQHQLSKLMKLILKKNYLCIIFLVLTIYIGLIFISGIILEQFTWGASVTFYSRCFAVLIVGVIIVTGCGMFFFTRKISLFLYGALVQKIRNDLKLPVR
ncbi:MAG: hypothetical protein LBE12_16755 [Planctomycetaceae bacterium]|jgi:hypothetical protein|nr:hypothetical protein [Planctomycetaceae bacterium]